MAKEEPSYEAAEVIADILRPIRTKQMIAYLEQDGWKLQANHFEWGKGWSLRPEVRHPASWIYTKSGPTNKRKQRFLVEVPGNKKHHDYMSKLQYALERLAAIEKTTFLAMVCRILGVEQIVLRPKGR